MKIKYLVFFTLIANLFLVSAGNSDVTIENQNLEKARNASKKLLVTLKEQLTFALKNGTPESAIVTCSVIAPEIAKNISEEQKISIKRVSLKYRNKNDKPDSYEEEKLNMFDKLNSEKKLLPSHEEFSQEEIEGKIVFRYMKPIITSETCIQCHGNPEKISEPVKKILTEKYPDDIATGYKVGDVRGAVSVIVEKK